LPHRVTVSDLGAVTWGDDDPIPIRTMRPTKYEGGPKFNRSSPGRWAIVI
jgi:hypothetical protein